MGEQYEITSSSCSNVANTLTNANSYTISDVFKYQMPLYYPVTTISGTSPGTCNNLVENSTILKINIKKKSIKLNFVL